MSTKRLSAEQQQDFIRMLKEKFDSVDKDNSGSLSRDELAEVMKMFTASMPLPKGTLERMMKKFDTNEDNEVSFDEFKNGVLQQFKMQ